VPNKTSQATPVSAFLLVLSQVSGAPNSHWVVSCLLILLNNPD
jgi:hypothetical protein